MRGKKTNVLKADTTLQVSVWMVSILYEVFIVKYGICVSRIRLWEYSEEKWKDGTSFQIHLMLNCKLKLLWNNE